MSNMVPDDAPKARASHVRKWADFNGYGFNLHAEKGKAGQFIGKVDADSPAESAGLKAGDRIVEVNEVNIGNENHQQVVGRIKAGYHGATDETKLLVVDKEADTYYKEKKIVVRGDMPNILSIATPPIRGGEPEITTNGHIYDEPDATTAATVTTVTETVVTEAQEEEREPTPEPEPEPEPEITEDEPEETEPEPEEKENEENEEREDEPEEKEVEPYEETAVAASYEEVEYTPETPDDEDEDEVIKYDKDEEEEVQVVEEVEVEAEPVVDEVETTEDDAVAALEYAAEEPEDHDYEDVEEVNKEPEPSPEEVAAVAAVAIAVASEPEPYREPTPPPREPTPPPREPTPPPPTVVTTTTVVETTTVNGTEEPGSPIDPQSGLELNLSVAQMKERLSSRRKRDARNSALNFKDKYEMFQRL